jgi:large subunit ribosomal protein L9
MKVILLRDVAKIGKKGSIVEVPLGFAQNKLLPNKMAKPATPENIKLMAHSKEMQQKTEAEETEHFKALLKALEATTVTVTAETNAQGHMFQALKPEAVAEGLTAALGEKILVSHVTMLTPIKSTGEHLVTFSWGKNKKDIPVHVVSKHQ